MNCVLQWAGWRKAFRRNGNCAISWALNFNFLTVCSSDGIVYFHFPVVWEHQCLWHWWRWRSLPQSIQVKLQMNLLLLWIGLTAPLQKRKLKNEILRYLMCSPDSGEGLTSEEFDLLLATVKVDNADLYSDQRSNQSHCRQPRRGWSRFRILSIFFNPSRYYI